jgi:hypothetical protein
MPSRVSTVRTARGIHHLRRHQRCRRGTDCTRNDRERIPDAGSHRPPKARANRSEDAAVALRLHKRDEDVRLKNKRFLLPLLRPSRRTRQIRG